eukprot:m.176238 g.176238  ORF g.176238 m.176238 type:complete len:223 (-) comp14131_c0_seq1:219-887(-)
MGIWQSTVPELPRTHVERLHKTYGFTANQIRTLWKRYTELAGKKGRITKADLQKVPELHINPLFELIYQIMDNPREDPEEGINFESFVATLSTFRPVDEPQDGEGDRDDEEAVYHDVHEREMKLRFLFRIYSNEYDTSVPVEQQTIRADDLRRVLKQMSHGATSVSGGPDDDAAENEEFLRNVIDQTMAEVDKDNSGEITFEEFKNILAHIDVETRLSVHFS